MTPLPDPGRPRCRWCRDFAGGGGAAERGCVWWRAPDGQCPAEWETPAWRSQWRQDLRGNLRRTTAGDGGRAGASLRRVIAAWEPHWGSRRRDCAELFRFRSGNGGTAGGQLIRKSDGLRSGSGGGVAGFGAGTARSVFAATSLGRWRRYSWRVSCIFCALAQPGRSGGGIGSAPCEGLFDQADEGST